MSPGAGEYVRTAMDVARRAKYVDVALTEVRIVEATSMGAEGEASEASQRYLTCRVLTSGYAAAASTSTDRAAVAKLAAAAERQSLLTGRRATFAPVEVSSGSRSDGSEQLTVDEAPVKLEEVKAALKGDLGGELPRGIVRLVQVSRARSIATSEGGDIDEVNTVNYLEARLELEGGLTVEGRLGASGRPVGSMIDRFAHLVAEEVSRARRPVGTFSPLYRGSRFDAILDEEAAGALAAAVADYIMGGGGGLSGDAARRLASRSKLALVDDPSEDGAPGSRAWDDEGVPTKAKGLLARERSSRLNTRLTALDGLEAGNAYGLPGAPMPGYSNIYFEPGDWSAEEIFEETRRAFYLRGAEGVQVKEGLISIRPRTAYLYSKDGGLLPVRDLALEDRLEEVLANVVGASKRTSIFPELRDGIPRGRGGPLIKLANVRFS